MTSSIAHLLLHPFLRMCADEARPKHILSEAEKETLIAKIIENTIPYSEMSAMDAIRNSIKEIPGASIVKACVGGTTMFADEKTTYRNISDIIKIDIIHITASS